MGLRVGKTLIRKKSSEAAQTDEDTTKVMFDLEKVNMEDIIAPSTSPIHETTVIEEEEDANNAVGGYSPPIDIFKLDEKARVTFDDILNSLQAKETTIRSGTISSDDELFDV